jgi:Membrane fusion protein Use1
MAPKAARPEPFLPHIPIPTTVNGTAPRLSEATTPPSLNIAPPPLPTGDLLLFPSDQSTLLPPSSSNLLTSPNTLLSPVAPASAKKSVATATAVLQNSSALQQELSDQLAQMASQLKRNAIHFSESLARDQAVVDDTQVKIEGNHDVMMKERIRLRDHRGKSGLTTCLVLMSLLVVVISFMLMFFVIRFT